MFQKIAKHRANDASLTMHRPPLVQYWGQRKTGLSLSLSMYMSFSLAVAGMGVGAVLRPKEDWLARSKAATSSSRDLCLLPPTPHLPPPPPASENLQISWILTPGLLVIFSDSGPELKKWAFSSPRKAAWAPRRRCGTGGRWDICWCFIMRWFCDYMIWKETGFILYCPKTLRVCRIYKKSFFLRPDFQKGAYI